MPRSRLDLDKLHAVVRRLSKDAVCDLLEESLHLLPERSILKIYLAAARRSAKAAQRKALPPAD